MTTSTKAAAVAGPRGTADRAEAFSKAVCHNCLPAEKVYGSLKMVCVLCLLGSLVVSGPEITVRQPAAAAVSGAGETAALEVTVEVGALVAVRVGVLECDLSGRGLPFGMCSVRSWRPANLALCVPRWLRKLLRRRQWIWGELLLPS